MHQSSSKTWSNEEEFMLLREAKKRNLIKLYNKNPILSVHDKGVIQLAKDINAEHDKKRNANAIAQRFYELRKTYGWPEALEMYYDMQATEGYIKEHEDIVNASDDGLMLINVHAFHHYVLSHKHNYNSALLAARVD
tara:strand:+ start:750 stop:1160 length:411 start_codon:yes stop_codon:yes gene_type:complete